MAGKKEKLNREIFRVAQEVGFDGKNWMGLSEELTEREILSVTGRPFTPNNLQRYCQREKIRFEIDLGSLKDSFEGERDTSPLSPEEIRAVRQMVEWWESRRMGLDEFDRRPMFKGKSKNTGIKINEELFRRAVEKAKKERLRTGGSLSGLIEWLLWKYLNEPQDIIESS